MEHLKYLIEAQLLQSKSNNWIVIISKSKYKQSLPFIFINRFVNTNYNYLHELI